MRMWLRRPVIWVPISVALLALVAWRSRVWEAGAILGSPQPVPILAALALNGAVALLWAIRSSDLLGATGHPVPIVPLIPMTAFANTINNLTPGSAGEIVRAWMLRAHHAVPYQAGAAVIVIERVVAIGYLGASAAILWVGWAFAAPGPLVVGALLVLAVSPGAFYGLGLRTFGLVARVPLGRTLGDARWARIGDSLRRMDETVAGVLTDPRRLVVLTITSGLIFAAYAAQLWLVGSSIGVAFDPVLGWGALGLAIVAGVLSLLPFGLGATDLVLATLLGAAGVPGAAAAAIAFGYRLVSTLPLGLIGAGSYAWLSARLPAGGTGAAAADVRTALAGDEADARVAGDPPDEPIAFEPDTRLGNEPANGGAGAHATGSDDTDARREVAADPPAGVP